MTIEVRFTGYVPAILESITEVMRNDRELTKYLWWREDGPFMYPSLLISAYYGKRIPNFREHFGIPKNFLVIGDSGGFQAWSKGEDLEPVEVLRWLEKNSDIGLTLDIPPPNKSMMSRDISWNEFVSSVKKSKRNYEIMERNRERYDFKLIKVFHGASIEEMEYFYQETKDINCDGWSLAPKPASNPISIALQASFLYEKGELDNSDWIHILGMSGTNTMPVIYYVKGVFNLEGKFSFDSSSWSSGGMYRKFTLPFSFIDRTEIYIGKSPAKDKIRVSQEIRDEFCDKLPCCCPVCSKISLKTLYGRLGGIYMSMHNLYSYLMYSTFLDFLSMKPDLLREYIEKYCKEASKTAIRIIDDTTKYGFKTAYRTHKKSITKLEPKKEVQLELW